MDIMQRADEGVLAEIVIPALNEERFLAEATESALRQRAEVEVIFVANGSTDGPANMADWFGDSIVMTACSRSCASISA